MGIFMKDCVIKNCGVAIQIQQNVNETFDYGKVIKILDDINEYKDSFNKAYGDKSKDVEEILVKIKNDCLDEKSPEIIKKSLSALKEITKNVTGNVITTGILSMLEQIKI